MSGLDTINLSSKGQAFIRCLNSQDAEDFVMFLSCEEIRRCYIALPVLSTPLMDLCNTQRLKHCLKK